MPTKKKSDEARKAEPSADNAKRANADKLSKAYEQALEEYAAALRLMRDGEHGKALEAFRAVEAQHANEHELADRSRTYAEICARKLEASTAEPGEPEGLFQLGVFRANEGRLEEALDLLGRALSFDPASAKYLYARASAYALQGRADAAVADLKRAVGAEPKFRFSATNDPDFDKIRDDADFIDVIEPTTEPS